ncbi:lipid-binding SYLF domain-containing protein [Cognatitamlana onchidii]|uniref:lipid-binding SYLF domain-containing protein n=1 Tax=Cognatitamlana onchidii TaxID=2562860 RepID=UPI0010A62771|nr:YSC84-related protein [Algibacter onchidii]
MKSFKLLVSTFTLVFIAFTVSAQVGGWKPELKTDADEALATMIKRTPKLESFKNKAYAYAVFPRITKAGVGIGGAAGKGIVYKDHAAIGSSKLKQASIGLQLGGQQYSEVIFFENKDAFEHFTNGNLKFDGQASAVAITEGASVDVAYKSGVAVFTHTKGGLMYEASLGGQHFTYEAGK